MVSGLLGNQQEGSTTAGNLNAYADPGKTRAQANGNLDTMSNDIMNSGNNTYQNNLNSVQNGAQSNLFGQNGALSTALGQYGNQVNQGFNLTNSDQTAYGQASGEVARQFGTQQQGLSQSLADRGLSNSGAAGAAFSGLQGSQNEQLAGLQTQIAQNRYNTNLKAMGQTQNFISQLGNQQNQATAQSQSGNSQALNQSFNQANQWNSSAQNQANTQLAQGQQTAHSSGLSNAFNGGMASLSGGNVSTGTGKGAVTASMFG